MWQGVRPAGQIVATGVGGAAAGLATGATIAATVPVAGWIVGGVLAGSAGVVALVQGVANRRLKKAEAVAWARRLGLPDPDEVPGFVVRLRKMDAQKRAKLRERYQRRLARYRAQLQRWNARPGARRTLQVFTFGILRGPERLRNAIERNAAKIKLIDALEEARDERRQGLRAGRGAATDLAPPRLPGQALPPSSPELPAEAPPVEGIGGVPWAYLIGGAVVVGALVLLMRQSGEDE
jgi:hypothetical protein